MHYISGIVRQRELMKLSELSLGPVFLAHVFKSSLFLSPYLTQAHSRTHTHALTLPCTHPLSLSCHPEFTSVLKSFFISLILISKDFNEKSFNDSKEIN